MRASLETVSFLGDSKVSTWSNCRRLTGAGACTCVICHNKFWGTEKEHSENIVRGAIKRDDETAEKPVTAVSPSSTTGVERQIKTFFSLSFSHAVKQAVKPERLVCQRKLPTYIQMKRYAEDSELGSKYTTYV